MKCCLESTNVCLLCSLQATVPIGNLAVVNVYCVQMFLNACMTCEKVMVI